MNIVSLRIKNFLSLTDVEIKPGQVNQVVGQNNQGKTSVLKALEFAVKGSSDPTLVKFGADQAEVIVELDDQTVIKRRLSPNGKQSVAVDKDGFRAPQPQSLLDALFDQNLFNPLELLDPKRRTDAILNAIDIKVTPESLSSALGVGVGDLPPLDYSQHGLKVVDQAHKYFYQRRAEANKDAAEKKSRWETYKADLRPETPPPLTREQLREKEQKFVTEANEAQNELRRIKSEHEAAQKAQTQLTKYSAALDSFDLQIKNKEQEIEVLRARRAEGQKFVDDAKEKVPGVLESDEFVKAKIQALDKNLHELRVAEKEIEVQEEIKKQRTGVHAMEMEYKSAQEFASKLSLRVESLAGPLKRKLMSEAEMPVAGLEYRDGGFLVDGVPVDNLSSSKAVQLAIPVARKLAKKAKLICLDGAELLDPETYTELRKQIQDDGYTYFLTKVGEPLPNGSDKVFRMDKGAVV